MPVSIERMMSCIQQRERVLEAGTEPSRKDVSKAIFWMSQWKGDRESGIPAKSLKVLSKDAKDAIADASLDSGAGKMQNNYMHETVQICLPKNSSIQTNNWRPICLNDIFKK